jgi:hypothetical protein
MARSRNIKPGFFTNDDLVELDFATRLLFAGLWTVADKAGRLEDRPKKIKIAVFPADDVNIEAMLAALAERDFIIRYSINDVAYIQIRNWSKHQNPHHTEKCSVIPACPNGELTVKEPLEPGQSPEQDGGNPADSLIPDSLIPDSPLPPKGADLFDEFWAAYPRKAGKDAARKAFSRRKVTRSVLAEMLGAIEAQKSSAQWTRDGGQFIPHPSTWLNEGRWQDEGSPAPDNMRRLVL